VSILQIAVTIIQICTLAIAAAIIAFTGLPRTRNRVQGARMVLDVSQSHGHGPPFSYNRDLLPVKRFQE